MFGKMNKIEASVKKKKKNLKKKKKKLNLAWDVESDSSDSSDSREWLV